MDVSKGLTKLDRLLIKEISGVDFGANEADGWLVMKSRDHDDLLKEAEEVEAAHKALLAAVDGFAPYLETAPDEVQAALSTVKSYLAGLLSEEPEGGEGEEAEQQSTDAAKSRLRRWFDSVFRKDDLDEAELREALGLVDLDPVDLRDALAKAVEAAAGQVAWDPDRGFESVRNAVQAALPQPEGGDGEEGYDQAYWVRDIALNTAAGEDEGPGTLGGSVLVEAYEDGGYRAFIAGFERGADGEVTIAPRESWVEVEMAWVERAKRGELDQAKEALANALSAASLPGV